MTASPEHAARLVLELAASDDLADLADRALRERGDVLAPALTSLTARADGLVAAAAVEALGRTKRSAAIPALRAAGARFALARPAARALVEIATPAAYEAAFDLAADPRSPSGLTDVFADAPAAREVLARALHGDRTARRGAAIEALGRCGAPEAVADVAPFVRDPVLGRAAVEALGRLGGDDAAAALANLATARSADASLVRALGATGSADAVAPLRALARESALGPHVAAALGEIPHGAAALALADLLAEPRTARSAADALAALPAGVVVPALLAQLDDPAHAGRAHRALALVAGADLGRSADAWRSWWDARRRSIPEEPR